LGAVERMGRPMTGGGRGPCPVVRTAPASVKHPIAEKECLYIILLKLIIIIITTTTTVYYAKRQHIKYIT